METLPKDILITIAKKVAAIGLPDLFHFMETSTLHRKIANDDEVLRALHNDCLNLLFNNLPKDPARDDFILKLSNSGHSDFCVVQAGQLLNMKDPDLVAIKSVLQSASSQGSDAATYFLLMLKVLDKEDFSLDEALTTFKDLFRRQQLSNCRRAILTGGHPAYYWCFSWTRPLPPGLVFRSTCASNKTCKGDGRRPNIGWPSPGSDDEYSMTDLCIYCRFDEEIKWFTSRFRFSDFP